MSNTVAKKDFFSPPPDLNLGSRLDFFADRAVGTEEAGVVTGVKAVALARAEKRRNAVYFICKGI